MFGWETAVGCALAMACFTFIPQIRPGERKEWFLAILSAFVLAIWQPEGLLVTLGMAVIVWITIHGRQTTTGLRLRLPTSIGVILLLLPLIVSKSLPLLNSSSGHVSDSGLTRWFVPLGISFTTFRLIGVLLDSSALKITVSNSRLALLSLFFPTFPSGPITTLLSLKNLGEKGTWRTAILPAGERILLGLGRKVLLADSIKQFVIDPWLAHGVNRLLPYQCLVLPVAFGMYIYWDFAGYSDIAIGIARLLGYQVPENFNRPYTSRNLIDFWRRWHITLSEWIRIRLMMKIAGRRAGIARLSFATILAMALCGLWHGFGFGYLLWGVWHGIGLVAVHLFGEVKKKSERFRSLSHPILGVLGSTILTFAYVTFGWIWFFLPLGEGVDLVRGAMQWHGAQASDCLVPLGLMAALLFSWAARDRGNRLWDRFPPLVRGTVLVGLLGIVTFSLLYRHGGNNDFIYTQF